MINELCKLERQEEYMSGQMSLRIIRGALLGSILGGCLGILFTNGLHFFRMTQFQVSDNTEEDPMDLIQDKLIRFHVRANSESEKDIALKYEVRDAVLLSMEDELKSVKSKEDAVIYLGQHLKEIQKIAEDTLKSYGCSYPVRAYIGRDDFPIREYGNVVLPAGNYQALRIDIGEARGENFWCILYPMMCYTMDSAAVLDNEDERALERELTDEEFEKLFIHQNEDNNQVKIKFKLAKYLPF